MSKVEQLELLLGDAESKLHDANLYFNKLNKHGSAYAKQSAAWAKYRALDEAVEGLSMALAAFRKLETLS